MRGITFVLGILATTALTASAFAADRIGVVGAANGTVTVVREGKPVSVKAGDAVYLNDVFETAGASEAQLIFIDRSTLTLTPKSKIAVDTYVYNPATEDGQFALNGAKGVFRFVGGALSKQRPVSIKTPVATIGIRGGIAETHVSETGATEAIFVYGDALSVTNQNGQTVTTQHFGSGIQLETPNGAPVSMPSAVVVARLGETVATTGVGSTAETRALAPSGTVNQDLNTNSSTSAETNDQSSGTGPQGTSAPAEENNSSTPVEEGGSGNASDATAAAPLTGQASLSTPGLAESALPPVVQIANVASESSTEKAIVSVVGQVAAENRDPMQVVDRTPDTAGSQGNTANDQNCNDTATCPPPAVTPVAPTAPANSNPTTPTPPPTVASTHIGMYGIWENADKESGRTASGYVSTTGRYQGVSTIVASTTPAEIGATNTFSVPELATDGWAMIPNFTMDGDTFAGEGFRTYGNAMQYYQLQGTNAGNTGEYITMVQGTSVAHELSASGRSGIKFYSFLPNIMAERSASEWGFFNYHTLSQNLTGDYTSSQAIPNYTNFGMVVDWTNKKYFGGVVNFLDASTPDTHYAKALFGDVDMTGGTGQQEYLKGYSHFFQGTDANVMGSIVSTTDGTNKVGKEIYATPGNPVSGMVLNYDVTNGATPSKGSQPVGMMTAPGTLLTNAASKKTVGSVHGFAGGLVVKHGAGPTVYYNDTPNQVALNKTGNGTVSAELTLHDPSSNTVTANFGGAAANAFIGDEMYAAQQGRVSYNGGTTTAVATSGNHGALIAAGHIANVTKCTSCAYTSWGVWSGSKQDIGAGETDFFHMIPYVVGRVSSDAELAAGATVSPGVVPYSGVAYANVYDNNKLKNVQGTMNAGISLATRKIDSLDINLAGGAYTLSMDQADTDIIPGGNNFSTTLTGYANGSTPISGGTNGALFGPTAQEVAGNLKFKNTSNTIKGAGIYQGAR